MSFLVFEKTFEAHSLQIQNRFNHSSCLHAVERHISSHHRTQCLEACLPKCARGGLGIYSSFLQRFPRYQQFNLLFVRCFNVFMEKRWNVLLDTFAFFENFLRDLFEFLPGEFVELWLTTTNLLNHLMLLQINILFTSMILKNILDSALHSTFLKWRIF